MVNETEAVSGPGACSWSPGISTDGGDRTGPPTIRGLCLMKSCHHKKKKEITCRLHKSEKHLYWVYRSKFSNSIAKWSRLTECNTDDSYHEFQGLHFGWLTVEMKKKWSCFSIVFFILTFSNEYLKRTALLYLRFYMYVYAFAKKFSFFFVFLFFFKERGESYPQIVCFFNLSNSWIEDSYLFCFSIVVLEHLMTRIWI